MAPTVAPSTSTLAWVTRWMRASMRAVGRPSRNTLWRVGMAILPVDADAARKVRLPGRGAARPLDCGAMTDLAAACLFAFARLLARLPDAWLRGLAGGVARLWRGLDARESRVARRNIELAYPGMPAAA